MPKADDVGRAAMRALGEDWIDGGRTCLTLTVYLELTPATEQAWRDGVGQVMRDVEATVRQNLPAAALGHPPVVICFSQMGDDARPLSPEVNE